MKFTKKALKEKRTLKKKKQKEKKMQQLKRDKTYITGMFAVDKAKWGINDNTEFCIIPEYYYDKHYNCLDCEIPSVWTAEQQQYFFEELGGNIGVQVLRCRVCSAHIQALKENQQRHMATMAEKKPHKNEAFFKKNF